MTSPCEEVADRIGDVRAVEELGAALVPHLASCADCRALADTHLAISARMQAVAVSPGEDAWDRIVQRLTEAKEIDRTSTAPSFLEQVGGWMRALSTPTWVMAVAVAVVLIAVVGSGGPGGKADGGLAYTAGGAGGGAGARDAQGHALEGAGTLALGNTVTLEREAWVQVALSPAGTAHVEGPGTFRLATLTRFVLESGSAYFKLPAQAAGFVVEVPHGEVRALGTEFRVAVTPVATRVELTHGILELAPTSGPAEKLEPGTGAHFTRASVVRAAAGGAFAPSASPEAAGRVQTPSPLPDAGQGAGSPPVSASPVAASSPAPSVTPVRPGGKSTGGF